MPLSTDLARTSPTRGRGRGRALLPAQRRRHRRASSARRSWTSLPGSAEEGASTITQQYIRNTILADERSEISARAQGARDVPRPRAREAAHKDEILELYLNTVYFGEGAYGAEAAAQTTSPSTPSELTLGEAALLAGLPQSPSRLSPTTTSRARWRGATGARPRWSRTATSRRRVRGGRSPNRSSSKRATEPEQGIYRAPLLRRAREEAPAAAVQPGRSCSRAG